MNMEYIEASNDNSHLSDYKLMNELERLIDENRSLIEEIKSLRAFYPCYDQASKLFNDGGLYNG